MIGTPATYGGSGAAARSAGPTLLDQFREFHAELTGIRDALAIGDRLAEQGQALPDPADVAVRINRRLQRVLDVQAAAMRQNGTHANEVFREAQYLMVALADEVLLLRDDWIGREHWLDNLLELSLFNSRVAGERVFQRLDFHLQSRAQVDPDLMSLYLAVLSLGFRGMYFRNQDDQRLHLYRKTLADRLSGDAGVRRNDAVMARLCPQSYTATVTDGRPVRLPHLRPWYLAFGVVITLYILFAHAVWQLRTDQVRTLTRSILAEATASAPVRPISQPIGQGG